MTILKRTTRAANLRRHITGGMLLAATALLSACGGAGTASTSGSLQAGAEEMDISFSFTVESPSMESSDAPFIVRGPEGGPFPEGTRTYIVRNPSLSRTLAWRCSASAPWLSFSTPGGLIGPGASSEVTVTLINDLADGLAVGEYPADIEFKDADVVSQDYKIFKSFMLQVYNGSYDPGMTVSPDETYQVSGQKNGALDLDEVSYVVANTGPAPFDWNVSSDEPWLVLPAEWRGTLESGEQTTVTLGIDPTVTSTFDVGIYTALAEFQVDGSDDLPFERPVELRIGEAQGGGQGDRVTEGLIALYDFEHSGQVIRDESSAMPQHDLLIEDPENVQWLPGALRLSQGTRLRSDGPATKIVDRCKVSNEITVEAWITPNNTSQEGPARILTISNGAYERDVTLGQGLWGGQPSDTYNVRLRSTSTDEDGMPLVTTPAGVARTELQHVVYTRNSSGAAKFFVDGHMIHQGSVSGSLSNWDHGHRLALGNEFDAWRPWLGDLHLIAIYERALEGTEVQQNFEAGPGDTDAGHLTVDPLAPFTATGITGGDFEDLRHTYTLANPGPEGIQWSAEASEPWTSLNSTFGSLASGEDSTLTVEVDADQVSTFPPGVYVAYVYFYNVANGLGSTQREVRLVVQPEGGGWNGEKPGEHNTGPTDTTNMITTGGMTITQPGTVIENRIITGTINVKADNVTIRNFILDGSNASYGIRCDYGYQNILIEHGEIRNCSSAGIYGRNFTARCLEIHEMGADGLKARGNTLIEGCWIHHLGKNPGAHADGNQTRSGSNITMRGNFFDMPKNIGAPYKSNAASINQAEAGPISNLVMENNWLNGGNYTVYFEAEAQHGYSTTNCSLINNRFGRDYSFGVLRVHGNVSGLQVYGNVWDDTGEEMDINDQY